MMRKFLIPALLAIGTTAPAFADQPMAEIAVRPGWRLASGDHVAALQITLAPGWKTYWRAPGDAGIPPVFDWSGSDNAKSVSVSWPTPKVFNQSGMRSVGYKGQVILPLRIETEKSGTIKLNGTLLLGLCNEICLPKEVSFSATLPDQGKPDPAIVGALADVPLRADEAGVSSVECSIRPDRSGLELTATVTLPSAGGTEETVIEVGNPMVWVAEPETDRNGPILSAETRLEHMDGKPFVLDRSQVRITVLGQDYAVDILGCD